MSIAPVEFPKHRRLVEDRSPSRATGLSSTFVRVALPAYNEAEALPELIPMIGRVLSEAGYPYDILVVNDCSTDNTIEVVRQLAEQYPIRLITHAKNLGLGGAITTCINEAVDGLSDDDIVVTMDADNTHPPQSITRMVPMIREGRDVVIASRYRDGAQVIGLATYRVWLSIGSSWMMRCLFGIRGVRDYTCGYRAYRVGILRLAMTHYGDRLTRESGFAAMAEVLLNIGKLNAVIGEVPLLLRYDQKPGVSKMRIFKTVKRTLAMTFRHRFGY